MKTPDLHPVIVQHVKEIREHLQECENLSYFRMDIEIFGRVHNGEVEIVYKLGKDYGPGQVSGNLLGPVVQEFLRRHGWNERHAPVAISFVPEAKPELNDAIPF